MALFNKLFTTRKNVRYTNKRENVSEKLFAFSKDQVRILLFRECDFRGRKLLFDSTTVEKIPVRKTKAGENKDFVEISDGFGYKFGKPPPDFNQLSEMVFGSVAMSFRGTYFKIHNLDKPNRFMLTQVFSSFSRSSQFKLASSPNNTVHSKLDDSGDSSGVSSTNSVASDAVLVCRRDPSTPLDVPAALNDSNLDAAPSFVADSGYCAESFLTCSSSGTSLSSNSLYKKWMRRTNTSLDSSGRSLFSLASIQNGKTIPQHRTTKLALAFTIELCSGKEKEMEQFLMEHVALLEAMSWRCRHIVEMSYHKTHNFASTMCQMTTFLTCYLVNLLSGSYITANLWLSLSNNGCDNLNSINAFNNNGKEIRCSSYGCNYVDNNNIVLKHNSSDYGLFNRLTDSFGRKDGNNDAALNFLKDFCELLETLDVKDTNFFMSTLVTAVLTHHLGWVNTCLPASLSTSNEKNSHSNPLWSQFSELYGACGYPTKLAQTIITGKSKKDLISKILQTLTYFIRCRDVDRKIPTRQDVAEENKTVDAICRQNSCIPKENYKQYEEHIKEIMSLQEGCDVNRTTNQILTKARTCLDLKQSLYPQLEELEEVDQSECTSKFVTNEQLTRKVNALCRVPTSAVLYHTQEYLEPKEVIVNMEKQMSSDTGSNDVVFVLGDDEQLVGLKKEESDKPLKRPTFLDLRKEIGQFRDGDFIYNDEIATKPSTFWSEPEVVELTEGECSAHCSRSQSEPPEVRKLNDDTTKSKYKYTGFKFSLQQYPQILSNYMKSKNLEMTNLHFGDKGMKIDELSSISETIAARYPEISYEYDESEALQTPSNASELEFTSDLFVAPPVVEHAQETRVEGSTGKIFIKQHVPNTVINELGDKMTTGRMKIIKIPMPKSTMVESTFEAIKYSSVLMRAASDIYMPNMVLQGPIMSKQTFEPDLRTDLTSAVQHSIVDQPVDEAVAIVANIDTWEVQLMSSHTFVIDKSSSGIRVGMSQMVANMLESLVQMWKLNVNPQCCLLYIEQTLQEFCLQSKALAELLLNTEFCSLEHLTSALHLDVNDVPLLLAVASIHTPQVTQKYGLSFQ